MEVTILELSKIELKTDSIVEYVIIKYSCHRGAGWFFKGTRNILN